MEEIFTAIETMTTGAFIIAFIKIVIVVLIICAIFEIAGNSKAIRREQEEQTRLLEEIARMQAEQANYDYDIYDTYDNPQ